MFKHGFAIGMMFMAFNANAVSFDCNKASTPIEKAICSDPLLGKLDDALTQNYKRMLAANIGDGAKSDLRATQKAWMAARNKCTNNSCIAEAYRQRVDAICDYPVISGAHPGCTSSEEAAGEVKAPEQVAQPSQTTQTATAQGKTFRVLDQFAEITRSGCVKEIHPNVKFGQFSNLKIDKCSKQEDGKYSLRIEVGLDRPFSLQNEKQLVPFIDAVSSEINIPRKKLLEDGLCAGTPMPKGFRCMIKVSDLTILASAYEGVGYLTINYVQP